MNERVHELAVEAHRYAYNDPTANITKPYGDIFEAKFAELIVSECAKLQYKNVIVGGVSDYNRGRRELAEEILKHFGVEE